MADAERKEKQCQRSRAWYLKNRELTIVRAAAWRAAWNAPRGNRDLGPVA